MMKTALGQIPPRCPLSGENSTVDSEAGWKSSVSSAAPSRRVLLRVCSLFSCSPAVDQPLLTFQRSHGILTVAGSWGGSASAGLCYGQHRPPPPRSPAVFTPCFSKKKGGLASVWTHHAYSQAQHFKKAFMLPLLPLSANRYMTDNDVIYFCNVFFLPLLDSVDKFLPFESNLFRHISCICIHK